MNIPNTITFLRILLVPALLYLLVNREFGLAFGVFLIAGASDALDGYIAKRFNMCTRLGAVLDPLADKLLVVSSVIVLARLGYFPWWLALTIIARDLVIVTGACVYYLRTGELEIAPSLPSKLNTVVQLCLIFLLLGQLAGTIQVARSLPALFAIALLTALVSGCHYVVKWERKAKARRKQS